ncbi:uncharacterized protein LOC101239223 [Hydra vulgaris]|uniref:uncharacterized protein LOC101239223 n=1 Tax=Hydra vulgaris TaxID=6087 RepID=UPI0002B40B61|nr:uncharacterized protein LOC101239223 [Hydra vulgaris]
MHQLLQKNGSIGNEHLKISLRIVDKFRSIVNFVSSNVYDYIEECDSYESVIETLENLYIKTPNEIFARHQLLIRHQTSSESLEDLLQELCKLSKSCNYQDVSAEQYREEQIRDAFISGINSNYIRPMNITHSVSAAIHKPSLCTVSSGCPLSLSHAAVIVRINDEPLTALIDSCSSDNFISKKILETLKIKTLPSKKKILMALTTMESGLVGCCSVNLEVNGLFYNNIQFGVLENLCSDIILGYDFQKLHKNLIFPLGGKKEDLIVTKESNLCALQMAKIKIPSLFTSISDKTQPIATKSRRYNNDDRNFIESEILQLLSDGIIEPCFSPWRAQVVVVKDLTKPNKKRLYIDYSQTVNLYTELDAYHLPRIDDMINGLAKIPFGVTNGVSMFKRSMDKFVEEKKLHDTFTYHDNITIGGYDQAHHDKICLRFQDASQRWGLNLNESKSVISASSINILSYCVSHNNIKPDSERLRPLDLLPPPSNILSLRRTLGMFSYYSKWIPSFANKVPPLNNVKSFPINSEALEAFQFLKRELHAATLSSIDKSLPFVVECDASDVAVSATLNQNGRPVAIMSRTLGKSEINYPSVEKEAVAIIEAVRKWQHLLLQNQFKLITDQRSVAFMFDNRKKTKIKNSKIQCWRMELAEFSYTISYRPGSDNIVPDALTRAFCAKTQSQTNLSGIHSCLCHPGITRMLHFVKSKNLPFSTEEVNRVCSNCQICSELKPKFYRSSNVCELIKSIRPMDRLSIDFKGPLPSNSRNKYLFTVIDEYSRYPFAFPCPNIISTTVVKGIATSNSTPYHPISNGQVEKYNGLIWKNTCLALKIHNLDVRNWEIVLSDALHSLRSLLSTATNCTPHERLFSFPRRSSSGTSLPSWLTPGPIFLRRFVRTNKNDNLVDKVELVDVNPTFANIRYPDGRESTISLQNLAPYPAPKEKFNDINENSINESSENVTAKVLDVNKDPSPEIISVIRVRIDKPVTEPFADVLQR